MAESAKEKQREIPNDTEKYNEIQFLTFVVTLKSTSATPDQLSASNQINYNGE